MKRFLLAAAVVLTFALGTAATASADHGHGGGGRGYGGGYGGGYQQNFYRDNIRVHGNHIHHNGHIHYIQPRVIYPSYPSYPVYPYGAGYGYGYPQSNFGVYGRNFGLNFRF